MSWYLKIVFVFTETYLQSSKSAGYSRFTSRFWSEAPDVKLYPQANSSATGATKFATKIKYAINKLQGL